jgi:hypothetical protein
MNFQDADLEKAPQACQTQKPGSVTLLSAILEVMRSLEALAPGAFTV